MPFSVTEYVLLFFVSVSMMNSFFISNIVFLPETQVISTYVVSHISELVGYGFIVASLIKVMQDGKKKKQTGDNKRHT